MTHTKKMIPVPEWARRLSLTLGGLVLAAAALWPQAGSAQTAAATPTVQLPDFTELAARVSPAVVNIRTTERRGSSASPHEMDPNMEEFLRRFGIPMPNRPDPRRGPRGDDDEPRQRGVGSGFIVSADGFIMTNAHVVDDADEVIVTLTDRRELKARIIGADRRTDVAVVKVDATGLPFVKIGDVNQLKVGEWVMAIGSPFGLDNTVTAGIVSAKQRDTGDYLPFIQTDVAINPGNSGGPLLNLRGEVVGINSQIYSRSGGYQGVSFAIPIDVAMNVGEQLQATGHVSRGKLGVGVQGVDQALAESFGLDKPRGALVSNVERGGPADEAGLKEGDVILAFDGQPVDSAGQLPAAVAAAKPGRKVELQVWREGASRNIDVTLGEVTDANKVAANGGVAEGGRLGVTVRPLSPAERSSAQVDGGLIVEEVAGPAAEAGIQPGDVVLSANGRPVGDVEQLRSIVAGAKNRVALLVQRGEARIFVPVELA